MNSENLVRQARLSPRKKAVCISLLRTVQGFRAHVEAAFKLGGRKGLGKFLRWYLHVTGVWLLPPSALGHYPNTEQVARIEPLLDESLISWQSPTLDL